jgi:hypothetical protein
MALRVGAESKPKLYAAVGLLALLAILAIIQIPKFFGGSSPTPAPPPPAATRPAAAPAPAPAADSANAYPHEAVQLPSSSALDPTLHPELMAQAEDTTYKGNGRNIFSPDSAAPVEIPKPNAPIRRGPPPPPPGPPPPPAIDLKFYGYSSVNGGSKEIFLLHGDDIFLAHEGDIVDHRYRVVAIRPFAVEIEDIPYHNTQSVPLSQN